MEHKLVTPAKTVAPPGLKKLIEQCQNLYPDQKNPLQVTALLKYWLGGQDPLDYISMYFNPGKAELNIPPHWHYITFGLSDLHGDGRVHQVDNSDETMEHLSGMGFELTFRLIKQTPSSENEKPPTWPANLLQALARYVFQTGNRFVIGDNVPWRKSLDSSTSNIQHMLIANDPQLMRTKTPFGWVDFCQIVGVTEEELDQASRWNGKGVLNLLKKDPTTGGEWLITNMNRSQSVFALFPDTLQQLEKDLENEGSDLAGVNADFTFKEIPKTKIKTEFDSEMLAVKCTLNDNVQPDRAIKSETIDDAKFCSTPLSTSNSLNMSFPPSYQSNSLQVVHLDGLQLTLAPYAAKFLILAIRDRIRHGRHFTFKNQNMALTMVSESVTGAVVSKKTPYGVLGYWMQVLIADDFIDVMLESFKDLVGGIGAMTLPREYNWPDRNLKIIIDNPEQQYD
ncbi:Suppressor of fused like [Pseudolycoriella hygida]|uniref:Suppressor of fused like n=1 Tax=Pseudolycoriella hygida TaxID=35572 RepID=A0A9Q0MJ57_9DIPT|nr:Suppressor of fused like [Pseudolycoriella hygida]